MNSLVNNSIKISGISYMKNITLVNFKKISIDTNLILPNMKADVDQIVSVTVNVNIDNSYIIETPKAISLEGQILTGKILIVSGEIKQDVEYLDSHITQSIHGVQFDIPFSTYVVLPTNINENKDVVAKGYIEDVYVKKLDARTFFENIILLIDIDFI